MHKREENPSKNSKVQLNVISVSIGLGAKVDWQYTSVNHSSSNLLEFVPFIIEEPRDSGCSHCVIVWTHVL